MNGLMRIYNYATNVRIDSVKYSIHIEPFSGGISLTNDATDELQIPYTTDMKSFIKSYLELSDYTITNIQLDKVYSSVLMLLNKRVEPIDNFFKSFCQDYLELCYVKADHLSMPQSLYTVKGSSVYVLYDSGVRNLVDTELSHVIYVGIVDINKKLLDVAGVDIVSHNVVTLPIEHRSFIYKRAKKYNSVANEVAIKKLSALYDSEIPNQVKDRICGYVTNIECYKKAKALTKRK
jgi:hypothetical protein